jgi:pre-mRNA-processing factor SLU7
LNANPTQGELLHHEFKQRKEELKDTSKISILAKYGGAEYLETAPKELREGQTEDYVEYSRTGQVIKGRERAKAKSKYPEDGKYCEVQVAFNHSWSCSVNQQPHRCVGVVV